MFKEDMNEMDFSPFRKVADKIDDCLSLIKFNNLTGNISEVVKKEKELKILREEIVQIKKRLKSRVF
ncbi:MAG: hypothetical protein M0Q88_02825 [Bacilli bacterium]|nr:hypothetical protein [Bacilli bacterium]